MTDKGMGWQHQQRRAALLRKLRDGDPCVLCGQPMWKADARNLDADHSTPRSLGGTTADRLTHASCNRSRGNGTRTRANKPSRPMRTSQPW